MQDESTPRIAPIWPPDWDAVIYDALSVIPHARDNVLERSRTGRPAFSVPTFCAPSCNIRRSPRRF